MKKIPENVGTHYKVLRKLDEGAFGQIFQGINTKSNVINLDVAIKFEPVNTEYPRVMYECKLHNHLHNDSTVIDKGLAKVYYCSTEGTHR
jgi:hypothetical protein